MTSNQFLKSHAKIILICLSISFVFRIGVSLTSEYYDSLVKQVEIDLAEKARSVGVSIRGEPTLSEIINLRLIVAQNHSDRLKAIENGITIAQAENAALEQELLAMLNKREKYINKINTSEEKNGIQNRFFWGLLLLVYTWRGMKAIIAYEISKEKKIIAFLFVWTFVHIILFIFGYNRWSGDESGYFFPITDDFWNNGHFEVEYYDMTELTVYVGGAWLIYFLYYYLKEDKKGIN